MIDPFLGINSPVRLLREQWKDPTSLAQELYAMFTATGPRELRDTLTIRVGAGQPALRVVQDEGDTIINEGDVHHFGITKNSTPTATAVPGRKSAPRPQDTGQRVAPILTPTDDAIPRGTQPASSIEQARAAALLNPAVSFDAPTRFSGSSVFDRPIFTSEPVFVNPATGQVKTFRQTVQDQYPQPQTPPMIGGGGTPAYFGKVVEQGASANQWGVLLFLAGASGALGASPVVVQIPFIADTETAPIGLVVGPIFLLGGEYVYQPPVWLE